VVRETRSALTDMFSRSTFFTINLTLICPGSSPKLERLTASFLNHGTVLSMTKS